LDFLVSRIYMVRHGRAAAGWNVDPDPGLDDVGRAQALKVATRLSALGPLPVVSSPLLRCQQTAFPLATAWKKDVRIESLVGEIPSPVGYALEDRVEWLRDAMAGTWEQVAQSSGAHYRTYREDVAQFVQSLREDTVISSHFIAINAAIGAATNDDRVVIGHLDNCSVSVFEASDEGLSLVEMGGEADTLIR
jgi:broad specificity phosphatase PhoE